jgi:hypothetical protein
MKAWDWHFEAEDGGLNCSGGWPLKSEAEAMKAGKRWMRETKRKGTITAKQVVFKTASYIADY